MSYSDDAVSKYAMTERKQELCPQKSRRIYLEVSFRRGAAEGYIFTGVTCTP